MGLDISVYRNCKVEPADFVYDEEKHEETHRHLLQESVFLPQAEGLEGRYIIKGERKYIYSAPYSSWSRFRNALAVVAGYTGQQEAWQVYDSHVCEDKMMMPFMALLNFTDCDGFIGPKTLAKLSKQFQDMEPRARSCMSADHYETYLKLQKGCEFAGENGFMIFH